VSSKLVFCYNERGAALLGSLAVKMLCPTKNENNKV